MKERIEYIDLAKGICILLVIQIHVYGDTSFGIFQEMSIFRMPLYYFLSGIFFKTYGNFVPFFKKKANKLLLPFFVFFIFSIIPLHLYFDFLLPNREITIQDLFMSDHGRLYHRYNGAIWFLISLFFSNLIFYVIYTLSKGQSLPIVIASSICGIIGYFLNYADKYLPLWFDTSLTTLPFFVMGYITRHNTKFISTNFCRKDYLFISISLLSLLGVLLINKTTNNQLIDFDQNRYNVGVACLYIGGLSGTYLILFISKKLNKVLLVSYIGRYSIVVLCTHILYIFILRNILYRFSIPQDNGFINTSVFIIIILLSIPTIKYGIKYLPTIFSQNDLWK